jgi:hypothetical protein
MSGETALMALFALESVMNLFGVPRLSQKVGFEKENVGCKQFCSLFSQLRGLEIRCSSMIISQTNLFIMHGTGDQNLFFSFYSLDSCSLALRM